jgi:hypothetical protein
MAPAVRRLVRSLGLLPLLLALVLPGADARVQICRKDPVVRIDGQVADILLSSSLELNDAATGPTAVVITVPTGVPAELLAVDRGFGGHGYDVRFAESDRLRATEQNLRVRVEVYVPAADGSQPVAVEFTPRGPGRLAAGGAEGTANAWVVVDAG